MAITYQVLDQGKTVLCRVIGELKTDMWASYRYTIASDPDIQPGFCELLDVSQMTELELGEKEVEMIYEIKNANLDLFGNRRGAIVVSDDRAFAMARYSEKLDAMNNQEVAVFNHVKTALTWLGLSQDARNLALSGQPYEKQIALNLPESHNR